MGSTGLDWFLFHSPGPTWEPLGNALRSAKPLGDHSRTPCGSATPRVFYPKRIPILRLEHSQHPKCPVFSWEKTPPAASAEVFPHLHEVHHRRLRGRGGGRIPALPGPGIRGMNRGEGPTCLDRQVAFSLFSVAGAVGFWGKVWKHLVRFRLFSRHSKPQKPIARVTEKSVFATGRFLGSRFPGVADGTWDEHGSWGSCFSQQQSRLKRTPRNVRDIAQLRSLSLFSVAVAVAFWGFECMGKKKQSNDRTWRSRSPLKERRGGRVGHI